MQKFSTKNLGLLPNPNALRELCKSISALEAIICQDWENRFYSFRKDWSTTEEVCEMRNGLGDQMLILFSNYGCCINGFAHESVMNGWQNVRFERKKSFLTRLLGIDQEPSTKLEQKIVVGVLEGLPEVFNDFIYGEPVRSIGTTFCIWQTEADNEWKTGNLKRPTDTCEDGSDNLLVLLDGDPLTFKRWAEEYYDCTINKALITKIFSGEAITRDMVISLNPEITDYDQLKSDLEEIGYAHEL